MPKNLFGCSCCFNSSTTVLCDVGLTKNIATKPNTLFLLGGDSTLKKALTSSC